VDNTGKNDYDIRYLFGQCNTSGSLKINVKEGRENMEKKIIAANIKGNKQAAKASPPQDINGESQKVKELQAQVRDLKRKLENKKTIDERKKLIRAEVTGAFLRDATYACGQTDEAYGKLMRNIAKMVRSSSQADMGWKLTYIWNDVSTKMNRGDTFYYYDKYLKSIVKLMAKYGLYEVMLDTISSKKLKFNIMTEFGGSDHTEYDKYSDVDGGQQLLSAILKELQRNELNRKQLLPILKKVLGLKEDLVVANAKEIRVLMKKAGSSDKEIADKVGPRTTK
jgi:hypothetical protein